MKNMQHIIREQNDPDEAFHFPQGMAGFPGAHRFAFIYQGSGDIVCMQSVDCPELVFLLTPWDEVRLGLPPMLVRDARQCLRLREEESPMWMLVLNPFANPQWVTANLQAPVAIHMEARMGLQCIRSEAALDLRYHWMPQPRQPA